MSLTKAERSAINKKNAAHARGPSSISGKNRSRMNAMTHGFRAKMLALPDEDQAEIQGHQEFWNVHFNPQSPAALHLVNACARASLMVARLDRYHESLLHKQMRDASRIWDETRKAEVAAAIDLLLTDPKQASHDLARTADGCQYLASRWEHLLSQLVENRRWTDGESLEAQRLLGHDPYNPHLTPGGWQFAVNVETLALPESQPHLDWYFEPEMVPAGAHPQPPPPPLALTQVLQTVESTLRRLILLGRQLRVTYDLPDRSAAISDGLMPQDPTAARLFVRYHAEARTAYSRNLADLYRTLARDAAEAENRAAEEAAEDASEGAETGVSPNEPNLAATPSPETASAPSPGPDPGPPDEPSEAAPDIMTDSDTSMSPERPISGPNGVPTTPTTAPTAPPA